jgi:apolipoprotein N-acyltransferase
MALTREAVGRGAQFVLWPESSTPFMFEEEPVRGEDIRSLVRDLGIPLLFGSDQLEREPKPRLYNAAFALGPEGTTKAVYRKKHLVPFGEFIPMKKWLFFASPLVESLAEFAPGEETVMIPIGDHQASTAICYEVVYPSLARDAVLAGSELLTTITNDAWYGHSSAPYQHFAMASMRAVEQGRYLVRAANTGISGIVDPYGRVTAESVIFERTAVVGQVRFLTSRTIYSIIGDAVAYAALALSTAMVLLPVLLTGRRREQD